MLGEPAFWLSFWPSLAATVIGVLLGVLLGIAPAVWIARRAELVANRAQRAEEAGRLALALQVLDKALVRNAASLQSITTINAKPAGTFLLSPQLETTTWEAVQAEITPFLHDAELQARVAYHFARIRQVLTLHRLYVESWAGPSSALSNAPQNAAGPGRRSHECCWGRVDPD